MPFSLAKNAFQLGFQHFPINLASNKITFSSKCEDIAGCRFEEPLRFAVEVYLPSINAYLVQKPVLLISQHDLL